MATMFPAQLSEQYPSRAEQKMFALLKDELPDNYLVFHNRTVRSPGGARILNERGIDFLIVKRGVGMLALEVKGAGVRCDGEGRLVQVWTSADGYIHRKAINPILQLKRQLFQLCRMFNKITGASLDMGSIGLCAVFPDVPRRSLCRSIEADEFIFSDDLPNLRHRIEEMLSGLGSAPPENLTSVLIGLMSAPWELEPAHLH